MTNNKIKINNYEYEIFFVEYNNEKLLMNDEEYHSGVTYFKEKEIYIANNLKTNALNYTISHELVHAFMDAYGFLQVEWNDEIIADFIAIYGNEIKAKHDFIIEVFTHD